MTKGFRVACMASGSGTDFQSIVDAVERGDVDAQVALLVCNLPDARVIERAKKHHIPVAVIDHRGKSREDFEREMIHAIDEEEVDLVVMVGFMRMLTGVFVSHYRNRLINIHPALLPSFPGTQGIKDALDYGVKVTGCTIHFVDEEMDHGPIIMQRAVNVKDGDSPDDLKNRVLQQEHQALPEVIQLFTRDRVRLEGRHVHILPEKK